MEPQAAIEGEAAQANLVLDSASKLGVNAYSVALAPLRAGSIITFANSSSALDNAYCARSSCCSAAAWHDDAVAVLTLAVFRIDASLAHCSAGVSGRRGARGALAPARRATPLIEPVTARLSPRLAVARNDGKKSLNCGTIPLAKVNSAPIPFI